MREQVAAHGKGRDEGPAGTPFLLIDGVCAGIWSRKKGAKTIELTVEPARKLSRDEKAGVEAEAERIGALLALEPARTLVGASVDGRDIGADELAVCWSTPPSRRSPWPSWKCANEPSTRSG